MAMITVRVSDEEKEWLDTIAKLKDVSISSLIKNYSMTELEDYYDTWLGRKISEKNEQTYSLKEVKKELGIED